MAKLNLSDLVNILFEKHNMSKLDAQRFLNTMVKIINDGVLKDKVVKIKGFGTFKIIDVEPRESVNVNTGERLVIEGHSKLTFQPDAAMKELVNKPFSAFETVVLNEGVEFNDED